MKFLFLCFGIFLNHPAFAQSPLHAVYAQNSSTHPGVSITVQFKLDGNTLHAHYEVINPTLNTKPDLGPTEYPYQFDTVELFLSLNESAQANLPYYEFEVSPLNQTFLVKILDPKKPFIDHFGVTGFLSSTQPIPGGWSADLSIPLQELHWNGDSAHLTGNAYAITGQAHHRTYWGLSLPPETKPNFHVPQYFKPLR